MSITVSDAECLANKKKITQKIFDGALTLRPSTTKADRDEFLRIMAKVKGCKLISLDEWIPKPCVRDADIYIEIWKEDKETQEQEKPCVHFLHSSCLIIIVYKKSSLRWLA